MSNIVDSLLSSEFKERIWGIAKISPNKDNVGLLKGLYLYGGINVDVFNIDNIVEKYKENFETYEHYVIFLNDYGLKNEERIKLKSDVFNKCLEINSKLQLKIWFHIITLEDFQDMSLSARFELIDFLATFEVLHDKGIFEIIKLTTEHKKLLLSIFHKYIVAYVIAGSQVKGRAKESSDIDVYIVIDDSDVRYHTFEELKSKLYAFAYSTAELAKNQVKSKKVLHPQVYTLTEFWYDISKMSPVIITFLRDGIAIYDRGTFVAWKLLLIKGIFKPTKESSEIYMRSAEDLLRSSKEKVRKTVQESVIENLAVGVITAGQSLLMRYGLLPPDPKETIELTKKIFVDEKKLLSNDVIEIMRELWKIRKDFEHGAINEIPLNKFEELYEKAEKAIKDMKSIIGIIDKEKLGKDVEIIINEYYVSKNTLEKIYGVNNLDRDIIEKINDIERRIEEYRKGNLSTSIENFLNELNNIIRMLKIIKEEKLQSIFTLYRFSLIQNNKLYDIFFDENSIYVVDDKKLRIYNYNGDLIDEKESRDLEMIIQNLITNGKRYIDEKSINALKKIFGENIYIGK